MTFIAVAVRIFTHCPLFGVFFCSLKRTAAAPVTFSMRDELNAHMQVFICPGTDFTWTSVAKSMWGCPSWIKALGFSTWCRLDQTNPHSLVQKKTLECMCLLLKVITKTLLQSLQQYAPPLPPLALTCVQSTAMSEKWLLHHQWIGPDKMVDSGLGKKP